MSDRLLPCAHCGSPATFMTVERESINQGGEYIDCTNKECGATSVLMFATGEDVKPLLAERWNKRAAHTLLATQGDLIGKANEMVECDALNHIEDARAMVPPTYLELAAVARRARQWNENRADESSASHWMSALWNALDKIGAPVQATVETERAAMVAQYGECCQGGDPMCYGGCLVQKAISKNMTARPDHVPVGKTIDTIRALTKYNEWRRAGGDLPDPKIIGDAIDYAIAALIKIDAPVQAATTTDECIELAQALEQARAIKIAETVAALAIGGATNNMPTRFQSGYQLACEEIIHLLRTQEWDLCLKPTGVVQSDKAQQEGNAKNAALRIAERWMKTVIEDTEWTDSAEAEDAHAEAKAELAQVRAAISGGSQ